MLFGLRTPLRTVFSLPSNTPDVGGYEVEEDDDSPKLQSIWQQMLANRKANMLLLSRVFRRGRDDEETESDAEPEGQCVQTVAVAPSGCAEPLEAMLVGPSAISGAPGPAVAEAAMGFGNWRHLGTAPMPARMLDTGTTTPGSVATAEERSDEHTNVATEDLDEDDDFETVLIEAQVTMDDGSVRTLVVKATDRARDVAKRFVEENALKMVFEEPLTSYLKKVENDAEVFPSKVVADLLEIRKHFSKSAKT